MIQVEFVYSLWWLPLCVVFAGAFAWWMYFRLPIEVTPRWVQGLRAMRFFAILLLLLLLLEPFITAFIEVEHKPIVVLLVDESESMVAHADAKKVRESLPELVRKATEKLSAHGLKVHTYAFGSGLRSLQNDDSLNFTNSNTNLSYALENLYERYKDQNLSAFLMITDGIATAGSPPIYLKEKIPQPIFSAWIGDTTTRRDLLIASVLYNELSYIDVETPIQVRIQSQKVEPRPVQVKLSQNGKVIQEKTVQLRSNYEDTELTFNVLLKQGGMQAFQIDVQEINNENNYRNNHYPFFIQVIEKRVKIALFAGGPHPDIGTFYKVLSQDPQFQLQTFIHKNDQSFYELPTQYSDYDVFILHNFPSKPSDQPILDKILLTVEQKYAALWVFAGNQFRWDIGTKLQPYLGVQTQRFIPKTTEAFIHFSQEFKAHATYTFDDEFIHLFQKAPPILKNDSEWSAKHNAIIVAKAKIKNIALDYPVFVLQEEQRRKNAVFLGEGIWRYRMHNYENKENFQYFDDWVKNTLLWLSTKPDKQLFKVYPEKLLFSFDEKVIFKGQAYDETYKPIQDADIHLTIWDEQQKSFNYQLEGYGGGYYGEITNLTEGKYRYEAIGKYRGKTIGTDKGSFTIGKSAIEFVNLKTDLPTLLQLANHSGGNIDYFTNLERLTDTLAQKSFKTTSEVQRSIFPLHRHWLLLLLILLLLSSEWILRKYKGLL